jgi:hypothetical protein
MNATHFHCVNFSKNGVKVQGFFNTFAFCGLKQEQEGVYFPLAHDEH